MTKNTKTRKLRAKKAKVDISTAKKEPSVVKDADELKNWFEEEIAKQDGDDATDSAEMFDQTTAMYKSRIINDIILLGIAPSLAGIALLELAAPLLLLALSEEHVAEAYSEGADYVSNPKFADARKADTDTIRKGLMTISTTTDSVH